MVRGLPCRAVHPKNSRWCRRMSTRTKIENFERMLERGVHWRLRYSLRSMSEVVAGDTNARVSSQVDPNLLRIRPCESKIRGGASRGRKVDSEMLSFSL
jgi:hypothetical protein